MTACIHSVDFIQHNEDLENLGTFDLAAYIVMAYIVMAYIVMAYIVMAYIVMAYIGTFDLAGVDNWRGMLKEFGIKLALLRGTDGAEIARYSP